MGSSSSVRVSVKPGHAGKTPRTFQLMKQLEKGLADLKKFRKVVRSHSPLTRKKGLAEVRDRMTRLMHEVCDWTDNVRDDMPDGQMPRLGGR